MSIHRGAGRVYDSERPDMNNDDTELVDELSTLLPPADPPPDLEEILMARVRSEPRLPTRAGLPAGRLRVLGAVTAVLVLALGAGNIAQWVSGARTRGSEVVPGLSLVILTGTGGASEAYGTVVLDPRDNGGVLAVRGLPRLAAGSTYQLWLNRGKEQRSCGIFGVSGDGYGNLLLEVPKDFRDFTSIIITVEPAGGSPSPSGTLVARSTR